MNRLLIIFILLNIYSLSAFDFNAAGLKIGYNSSHFSGNEIYGKSVNNIPGFIIGGFITYDINQYCAFDTELLLATKGSLVNTIGDIDQHNVIVYLELPLALKYRFLNTTSILPMISCGSSFAVKTLAMNDTGVWDNIRNCDFCFLAAAGFEYHNLTMELFFLQGMLRIEDDNIYNQTISLQIGIKLLKEKL